MSASVPLASHSESLSLTHSLSSAPHVPLPVSCVPVAMPVAAQKKSSRKREREAEMHGRWSAHEHSQFLLALQQFGRDWERVRALVPTRSLAQIRSHAQKHFLKISRQREFERLVLSQQQQQELQEELLSHAHTLTHAHTQSPQKQQRRQCEYEYQLQPLPQSPSQLRLHIHVRMQMPSSSSSSSSTSLLSAQETSASDSLQSRCSTSSLSSLLSGESVKTTISDLTDVEGDSTKSFTAVCKEVHLATHTDAHTDMHTDTEGVRVSDAQAAALRSLLSLCESLSQLRELQTKISSSSPSCVCDCDCVCAVCEPCEECDTQVCEEERPREVSFALSLPEDEDTLLCVDDKRESERESESDAETDRETCTCTSEEEISLGTYYLDYIV